MSMSKNPADVVAAASGRDEEYLLTEAEARIATTLALMTGFSQGCCALHRAPMAERVAEQLAQMAHGSDLSADMRDFLLRLCQRWACVASSQSSVGAQTQQHEFSPSVTQWHNSPETLQ